MSIDWGSIAFRAIKLSFRASVTKFASLLIIAGLGLISSGNIFLAFLVAFAIRVFEFDEQVRGMLIESMNNSWLANGSGLSCILSGVLIWIWQIKLQLKNDRPKISVTNDRNWIIFCRDHDDQETKYTRNGLFKAEIEIVIMAGNSCASIESIDAVYYKNGCSVYMSNRELKVRIPAPDSLASNVAYAPLAINGGDLEPPFELGENDRKTFLLALEMRPTLQSQAPVDCQEGEVAVAVKIRVHGQNQIVEFQRFFRYTKSGKFEDIEELSVPPTLNNTAISQAMALGKIDSNERDRLCVVSECERYMAVNSSTVASNLGLDHEWLQEVQRRIHGD